ncbi:DUF4913 domain-containing protein [Rhodococcus ruber]|uniref:DUF4913 domain-containing protein n=1 Tax=Rhodococcus ruber TaxID=1830 RepID=UPI00265D6C48|nr:DUF4913 domain-containing protein [Rhodococcus ruber]MDO1481611.1 DUF4913 domain-containing protein [Rhodococcus ruber]
MVGLNTAASDEWAAGDDTPDGEEYEDEFELGDEFEDDYDDDSSEHARIEPKFTNVVEFVQGFFLPVIRRRVSDNDGGQSWDPQWWAYPEVVARLTALHQAWEEARISDSASAMSAWWIQHLEPHLRVILDGDTGPMANATSDRSFMGWPVMPAEPVPAAVLAMIVDQSEEADR